MIWFERLYDTNFSNLYEMKYQKIIVKKEFALGIAAASSDKGFFNLVGDIAESPTLVVTPNKIDTNKAWNT